MRAVNFDRVEAKPIGALRGFRERNSNAVHACSIECRGFSSPALCSKAEGATGLPTAFR